MVLAGALGSGFSPGFMSRFRAGWSKIQRRMVASGVRMSTIATLTRPPESFRFSCTATTRTAMFAAAGPTGVKASLPAAVHCSEVSSAGWPSIWKAMRLDFAKPSSASFVSAQRIVMSPPSSVARASSKATSWNSRGAPPCASMETIAAGFSGASGPPRVSRGRSNA